MAFRAILLLALLTFLFADICRADDATKLPSRKASVVLPLLIFSPQDSPEKVLERINKILGQAADVGESGGPSNNFWNDHRYLLDDKTIISVSTRITRSDAGIRSRLGVAICKPGQTWKTLYIQPKP